MSVHVTFLGAASLLVQDDRTALLTDGFFSRPTLVRALLGPLRSDARRIRETCAQAGISKLDAVFVAHSHYDHALDSATVARLTDADLYGSASTRMIARTHDFDLERYCTLPDEWADPASGSSVPDGRRAAVGDFTVTSIPMPHSSRDLAPGHIRRPLAAWTWFRSFKTGTCYSFHVAHPAGSVLIHPSGNVHDGALDDYDADTIYLGAARLGKMDRAARDNYWRQTVEAVEARVVVPIHWDNLFRALQKPLRPFPRPIDDFYATMRFLHDRCTDTDIHLHLPRAFRRIDPFAIGFH